MNAAPFLPEEIIADILKRLPVKSLIRFQCVCKQWKSLFKSPYFIADHLRHSSHHNPSLLFFYNFALAPLQIRLLNCEMQVRLVQNAPPFSSMRARYVSIIGSSNGLLLVAIREIGFLVPRSLLLWNPATRDLREVPRSKAYKVVLGFGFSSFVDDYKIVEIDAESCRGEVYSIRTDSWKEIEFGSILEDVTIYGETMVRSNGAMFWNGSKREEWWRGGEFIVSFDMATELLTFIPCPTGYRDLYSYFNLTVYNDKLAALVIDTRRFRKFDLWVMEEDIGSSEKRWNWTKKLTGGPCPWELYHGCTIGKNEIVMSATDTRGKILKKNTKYGLCLFNVTTKEFKIVVVPRHDYGNFLGYVESLVPVHNIEER